MSFNYPEKYWSKYVLADVCDYSKEKILTYEVTEKNYVSTENMQPDKGGVIEASNLPNSKNVVKYSKGDTLISNIRPYFKKIWIADKNGGASNDVLVFRCKSQKVIDKYLYYFLSQDKFFDYVMGSSKGTKMPRGDKDAIMKYTIYLPKLEEQKVIVNVLSTIDEKIQVNNQINKKLEKMAKAILKRWFIDFEFPDENGNPYKSSGGEMVESEMGMIPKGWKVRSLYDIAEYLNGTSFKKNEVNELEGIPIVKIAELKQGITDTTKYCTSLKDEKYYLENGVVLFSWSGNPETSIDTFIWDKGKGVLNQHIFKVKSNQYYDYFIYVVLKYFKPAFTHIASNKQTTGLGHVTVGDLKRLKIVLPDNKDCIELQRYLVNIIEKIQLNQIENMKLKSILDILLPKLMSGEIRVTLDK